MAEEKEWEIAKLALSYAAENRRAEIGLLWSRSLYFWGFIAVVLVAYSGAYEKGMKNLALIAACFGGICSLCWSLANRSGKYWQEVWEKKTEHFARTVVGNQVFPRSSNPHIDTGRCWGPRQYSPSRLTMAVSDTSILVWFALAAGSCRVDRIPIDTLIIATTVVCAVMILVFCRSEQDGRSASLLHTLRRERKSRGQ